MLNWIALNKSAFKFEVGDANSEAVTAMRRQSLASIKSKLIQYSLLWSCLDGFDKILKEYNREKAQDEGKEIELEDEKSDAPVEESEKDKDEDLEEGEVPEEDKEEKEDEDNNTSAEATSPPPTPETQEDNSKTTSKDSVISAGN